ncbi:MAG TPA: LAGLIDADG family homing endonuclease [Candidatus Paceibacterota bacterium]
MLTRNQQRKMSKKEAARMGGLARQRIHGDLGTIAGRRKGGLNSLATHARLDTRFKRLRSVRVPRQSALLAELLGTLSGDGHVDAYQTTLTTNSKTDIEHALHVSRMFKKLFGIRAHPTKRKKQNACVVVISSKMICDFLVNKGMVRGNKIANKINMPEWVLQSTMFRRAFTRGLFDTDGSVYVDTHRIRGRTYRNLCMVFSNKAEGLLWAFKRTVEELGLRPTQKTSFEVFLRREKDIRRYFNEIGSSNPKHTRKVLRFFSLKNRRGVRVV